MNNPRGDFPILKRKINGKRVVYLDSAAMALKPESVILAVDKYYRQYSANVFRGVYRFSEQATLEYEKTREKVAKFINAKSTKEIIFVRNTTEAINLVAYCWGRLNIDKNDEITTTIMEHHSNYLPWQQLCFENNAKLKVIDVTEDGFLDLITAKLKTKTENLNLDTIITNRTKLLAIVHVSNALGTINPLKQIIKEAKRINPKIVVLVDGAQAIPHMSVDVASLGCDFYAFSGQKMLGPTGAGVLWGRQELLEKIPPFLFGGEMIRKVRLEKSVFAQLPHKFEAGTPHIAGVIGLGAAVDYLVSFGMDKVRKHEEELVKYALERLGEIKEIKIYGPQEVDNRGGVVSFNIFAKKGKIIHPHDVSQILDEDNIYLRAGHHCTMPLHQRLGIPASVRASFYIYNIKDDIDMLIRGVKRAINKLGC